jgi:hypothetical protein
MTTGMGSRILECGQHMPFARMLSIDLCRVLHSAGDQMTSHSTVGYSTLPPRRGWSTDIFWCLLVVFRFIAHTCVPCQFHPTALVIGTMATSKRTDRALGMDRSDPVKSEHSFVFARAGLAIISSETFHRHPCTSYS